MIKLERSSELIVTVLHVIVFYGKLIILFSLRTLKAFNLRQIYIASLTLH